MDHTQCRRCRAAIAWVVIESGKRMPLDAAPTANGTIRVDLDAGTARVVTGEELVAMRAAGKSLHTSHFDGCPAANQHRPR